MSSLTSFGTGPFWTRLSLGGARKLGCPFLPSTPPLPFVSQATTFTGLLRDLFDSQGLWHQRRGRDAHGVRRWPLRQDVAGLSVAGQGFPGQGSAPSSGIQVQHDSAASPGDRVPILGGRRVRKNRTLFCPRSLPTLVSTLFHRAPSIEGPYFRILSQCYSCIVIIIFACGTIYHKQ